MTPRPSCWRWRADSVRSPWGKALRFGAARPDAVVARLQRLLGKLNTAPSRTPAEGQRCVMVLRLV